MHLQFAMRFGRPRLENFLTDSKRDGEEDNSDASEISQPAVAVVRDA